MEERIIVQKFLSSSNTNERNRISPKTAEQKANEQVNKVWNNLRQTRDKKKKSKDREHFSNPTEKMAKQQEKNVKIILPNKSRSSLTPSPLNETDANDEALARELQERWNIENIKNQERTQKDAVLATLMQEMEDFERRERIVKERMKRNRERRLRLQRQFERSARSFPDVDNMTYEELLALEEQIGNVKSHGATNEEIYSLPISIVEEKGEHLTCSICLCEFVKGDIVKTLPCLHKYHSDCVDQWLVQKKNCAICLQPITEDSVVCN